MNTGDAKLAALNAYFHLMNMNGAARVYRAAQELGVHGRYILYFAAKG